MTIMFSVEGMHHRVVSAQLVWARSKVPWIGAVTVHLFEEILTGRIKIHTALAVVRKVSKLRRAGASSRSERIGSPSSRNSCELWQASACCLKSRSCSVSDKQISGNSESNSIVPRCQVQK